MILRDAYGKLIIICRSKCKDETVYNEKIYAVRATYLLKNNNVSQVYTSVLQGYTSVLLNPPKDTIKSAPIISKYFSDD